MVQTIQQEFFQGVQDLSNGKYQQAISHLEKSLKLNQSSSSKVGGDHEEACYFNLGQARKASNNFEGAISDFQNVISRNPRKESAYMRLAECCFELETYDAIGIAIDALKTCTRYFPQNEAVYMNLGIACIKIGDKDDARSAFSNAKRLGNKDADRFIKEWC